MDTIEKLGKRRDREELKAKIAVYLDGAMWRNDYTEERLAEQSGIDRSTIYRILHKKTLPNENTLVALAKVVGVGLLFEAGYTLANLPAGFDTASITNEPPKVVQIPDLEDAELTFYLKQIGQTDPKTREIIKNILKAELSQQHSVSELGKDGEEGAARRYERPDFARKLPADPS